LNTHLYVDAVEPLVARVVLVHPQRVKAIASTKLKNDRVDSATLAHLLRAHLLPAAWEADRAARELRQEVRLRVALGQQRARSKNQVHAVLHQQGRRALVRLAVEFERPSETFWGVPIALTPHDAGP